MRRASALKALGRVDEAITAYRGVLNLDPDCKEALDGLKKCQQMKGKATKAWWICTKSTSGAHNVDEEDEEDILRKALALSMEPFSSEDKEEDQPHTQGNICKKEEDIFI